MLGVGDSSVDLRLFVARLVVADKVAVLLERLPNTRDAPRPQDTLYPREERILLAIPRNMPLGQVEIGSLRHGQTNSLHEVVPLAASARRG